MPWDSKVTANFVILYLNALCKDNGEIQATEVFMTYSSPVFIYNRPDLLPAVLNPGLFSLLSTLFMQSVTLPR